MENGVLVAGADTISLRVFLLAAWVGLVAPALVSLVKALRIFWRVEIRDTFPTDDEKSARRATNILLKK